MVSSFWVVLKEDTAIASSILHNIPHFNGDEDLVPGGHGDEPPGDTGEAEHLGIHPQGPGHGFRPDTLGTGGVSIWQESVPNK